MFTSEDGILHWHYDGEHLQIQPWGPNAFRVRCTKQASMPSPDWALSEPVPAPGPGESHVDIPPDQATLPAADDEMPRGPRRTYPGARITNGALEAAVTAFGKVTMTHRRTGAVVLEEYSRTKLDASDPKTSAIQVRAREFRPRGDGGGAEYHLTYRLEPPSPRERLYGMGQYQQPFLDLKGLDLELAQRNSQASVPFLVSSLGYGLLWNHPGVGRAVLGRNVMSFEAASATCLDYWIVVASAPSPPSPSPPSPSPTRELLRRYADATGHAPAMPERGLGFWQSKLRYRSQAELLAVAREHRLARGLPLDVIVADYFHWPLQGDWAWDAAAWPDPAGLARELGAMGVALLASVWPTVDKRCARYAGLLERGGLVRVERGVHTTRDLLGQCVQADFTNPATRAYVWAAVRRAYLDRGVRSFWLDEAEPEYNAYAAENYRYHAGPAAAVGNVFPLCYAQAFYEGQRAAGQADGDIVNLVRCAWAGSQKYGVLVWSGDTASSWTAFRNQLAAGLNMGLAGIPWWTTDIGGFYGGNSEDPAFRELLVRWFQWGTFCPVMRLHGCREPVGGPGPGPGPGDEGGAAACPSGADNELWSFGDDNYPILARYVRLRERLRGYVRRLMREASEDGCPVMRTMFFEFPGDERCWEVERQYMFGDRFLCAPVMEPGVEALRVYLPAGRRWTRFVVGDEDDETVGAWEGGQDVVVPTPIDSFPIFVPLED